MNSTDLKNLLDLDELRLCMKEALTSFSLKPSENIPKQVASLGEGKDLGFMPFKLMGYKAVSVFMTSRERRDVSRKLRVLKGFPNYESVSQLCRHYGISRELYYRWKRTYQAHGEAGLVPQYPGTKPGNGPNQTPKEIEQKVTRIPLSTWT